MIDQKQIFDRDAQPELLPITEYNKETFLKAVLTNDPYAESFEILGGKQKLTFKGVTVEENEDILKQVKIDQANGSAENTDAYFITLASYRLGVSLSAIDDKPYLPDVTKAKVPVGTEGTYVSARAKEFKKWPAFKLSVYLNVHQQFEDKIIRLGKEIQSVNFWTASK
jgi:hypothetical protein